MSYMDQRIKDTQFAASLDFEIPTIDLHGTPSIYEALEQLERELFLFAKLGHLYCRVVTGIGTGALQNAVVTALEKNPMVAHVEKEEQGGSLIVIF